MPSGSAIRLRLQRFGRIHRPFYRIVACSRYAPRDGKFMEILGTYNPIPDPHGNKQVTLKVKSIKKWLMHGAEPSDRVAKLLGLSELLPPPPRRALVKAILEEPPPPPPEDEDDVDVDGAALVEEADADLAEAEASGAEEASADETKT